MALMIGAAVLLVFKMRCAFSQVKILPHDKTIRENDVQSIYLPWCIKFLRRRSCHHRLFLTTLKEEQRTHKCPGLAWLSKDEVNTSERLGLACQMRGWFMGCHPVPVVWRTPASESFNTLKCVCSSVSLLDPGLCTDAGLQTHGDKSEISKISKRNTDSITCSIL